MSNHASQPRKTACASSRLPPVRKRRWLCVLILATCVVCVAGSAPPRLVAAHDPRPCGIESTGLHCYTPGDYDGDGKSDLAIFRPDEGVWYIYQSLTEDPKAVQWGLSGDMLVPADYDGDRKEDYAIYRPRTHAWWILKSSDQAYYGVIFGHADAKPVPADYDGDGKADIAVVRPASHYEILQSRDYSVRYIALLDSNDETESNHNDINVPGDYDGDGVADAAVYHEVPAVVAHDDSGLRAWVILNSSTGHTTSVRWGDATDIPVPADYDGDGKTDIAVWRPGKGAWLVMPSATADQTHGGLETLLGDTGDKVAPGDYDGDGRTDCAVWRPAEHVWRIKLSSTGVTVNYPWGLSSDIPVPMATKRPVQ